jgi:hypothetical protein
MTEDGVSSAKLAAARGVPTPQNAFWISLLSVRVRQSLCTSYGVIPVPRGYLTTAFNLTDARDGG